MEEILSKLDVYTRQWASNLTLDDIAKLLQSVYKLPGLLETLKYNPVQNITIPNITIQSIDGVAANIGKVGEVKFADICRGLPSNYQVQDTSKQGKKGDFIITYSNTGTVKRCLVDIKNYSSTVPKKEIDKFYEDLTFGSYDAGLIISYKSKFVGIADHVYIEESCLPSGKIPVMYLVSNDEELVLQSIELIIAKSIIQQAKDINIDRIESLIEHINSALTNSADVRRLLSELQTSIAKSIQKCQENLVTHEAHVKRAVKEMSSCVSKVMVNRVMEHVPYIESRDDNTDPSIKVESPTSILESNTSILESPVVLDPSITLETNHLKTNTLEKKDNLANLHKICKSDRSTYIELLNLKWDEIDNDVNEKFVCELTSTNMVIRIAALKTRTTVVIDFLEELEIPESDLENITHKITKDGSFICLLNDHLVKFIEKFYLEG